MTPEERAATIEVEYKWRCADLPFDSNQLVVDREHLNARVACLIREVIAEERAACAAVAEAQPYYPDTHTGMRQQWVKDRIAAAIRARGNP